MHCGPIPSTTPEIRRGRDDDQDQKRRYQEQWLATKNHTALAFNRDKTVRAITSVIPAPQALPLPRFSCY
jgi:hypothetical protein